MNCGVSFLWPYISDELVHELYQKSYFTGVDADGKLAAPGSSSDYESEFAAARLEKFAETVQLLTRYAPHARTVLDIGAATGEFLAIASRSGLETTGIEISRYAAERAKQKYGLTIHETTLEDYRSNGTFDLIHLSHVFEHFRAPHQALERIDALLAPDGAVYVEVPFQFNMPERVKFRLTGARKAFDVFSIHHPVFYDPATLRRVFGDHGFVSRHLRVFAWSRYPATGMRGQLKRLLWFGASLLGQGLFVEAVFTKQR
jgi:SAM-dependent methyltransferase